MPCEDDRLRSYSARWSRARESRRKRSASYDLPVEEQRRLRESFESKSWRKGNGKEG